MKTLIKYLKGYEKECFLAPFFKLLEACMDLIVPLAMSVIIDQGIENQDLAFIRNMAILLVVLAAVGLLCAITAQFFAAKAAAGFGRKLRSALFRHIQSLSAETVDEIGTSTLVTRMTSDVNTVQNGVNLCLRLLLRSPIVVFGAMIMALSLDWKTAMVFVVVIPLLLLSVFIISGVTIPGYRRVQSVLDRVLGITHENLTGVRVIRAFRMEQREVQEFDSANAELTALQLRMGRISVLLNPLTYLLINLGVLAIIQFGGVRVNVGSLTQGEVVAMMNYAAQILTEGVKLANFIILMAKMFSSAGRIQSVFQRKAGMEQGNATPEEGSGAPVVELRDVSLTYKGAAYASLSHIHLKVTRGETIGIIGGTGAGKTSLISLLSRFYDATEGQVLVDGLDVKEYALTDLRSKIGLVPQKAQLFAGTIRSNLLWGNENATEDDLWRALKLAQADEMVREKEGGLDAVVTQNGRNFSGGQRQRLTIARALVRRPEILILDDSASALDYATDARLRMALKSIAGETTTFIVSQRASSLLHADQILVLEDGEPVGLGTSEELLKTCPVYREIYETQFQSTEKEAACE